MHSTSVHDLDQVMARAERVAADWAEASPGDRAIALVAAADALMASAHELIAIAIDETGLAEARLTGELKRTAVQLRLFAEVINDGSYLDVRIDDADPDFVLGPRPDLRRFLIPVGPVLNFSASNFPFAFSVAGGDTASAIAAGCPVVVKAHPGHPRLSEATAAIVSAAFSSTGAPDGLLQVVFGQDAGVALLRDSRIHAASFTGSILAGQLLSSVAASRPTPIPFFGELGSVNPVFVTRAALDEGAPQLAEGFVMSVSGSAGQLCTKPGFLFLPAGHGLEQALSVAAGIVPEHRLLYPGIAIGYRDRREAILGAPGVTVIAEGSLRFDHDDQGWVTPTLVGVTAAALLHAEDLLLDEAFGPLAIVVEYDDEHGLADLADRLFAGNLTGTVHTGRGEDNLQLRRLIGWLTRHTGRVLFGGWPTGVAVSPAMQHGGPWPATTNDSGTSVGTAAISRFVRAVSYQGAPQELLPAPLRDDNPWMVPQQRSPAGESRGWGARESALLQSPRS